MATPGGLEPPTNSLEGTIHRGHRRCKRIVHGPCTVVWRLNTRYRHNQ
jgi:hypothetical protein